MTTLINRSVLLPLAVAAGLGLLARAAIPAGFMPAPLAAGWPITACPAVSGLPAAMAGPPTRQHQDHHGGVDGESGREDLPPQHERESTCLLGLSLAAPSLLAEASPAPFPLEIGWITERVEVATPDHERDFTHSRAPPR